MGLMGPAEWMDLADGLAAIRDDNAVNIALKRGATVLPAQTVRVARMASMGQVQDGGGVQQATGRAVVLGATTLDIRTGDRFVMESTLYEVTLVRPNRRAATVAEAKVIQ